MTLKVGDFDYPLDPGRIAQHPADRRDQSRLLRLRRDGGAMEHHVFRELPELLRPGDLLVVNDTRVIPARFFCLRGTGGRIEGLFLHETQPGQWRVLLKGANRCREGERMELEFRRDAGVSPASCSQPVGLSLLQRLGGGEWTLQLADPRSAVEVLADAGIPPLPPYIHRDASAGAQPEDQARYQTVFADRPGAVAAPTAGLHFTPELLARLAKRGIQTARVTLHVGLGTFQPIKVENPAEHPMHEEWYDLPAAAAEQINAARAAGRRVVAVGTTSVRVLESVARLDGQDGRQPLAPAAGWTRLFLYPPAEFLATDALITNFHLPRSTLLMLVAAFCSPGRTDGLATILTAYRTAADAGYRFYSYGDAMLIE